MEFLQQALSIAFVFGLLGVMFWVLRGKLRPGALYWPGRAGANRQLESIDRLMLTPQHSVHLIRAGGKEVLLSTHPQGCTVISEAPSQKAMGA